MRARTLIFAMVCGTATAAMAQNSGYVRFLSPSPDACAVACSGDQMCASWSYGAGSGARSYGQSQAGADSGMCTFSGSSTPRTSPGMISGLPRRGVQQNAVPWVAGPPQQSPASRGPMPQQGRQNYTPVPTQARGPTYQAPASNRSASGWDVRPAPWLSHSNGANAPAAPYNQAPQYQNVPPLPSTTPYNAPRIEYEPQTQPAQPNYSSRSSGPTILVPPAQPQPQPQYRPAPAYTPPVYSPPPVQSAPVMIAPPPRRQLAPMVQPPPPPQTQEMPDAGSAAPVIALPTRPRAARGVPIPKAPVVAVSPPVAPRAPAAIASQQPPPAAPPRQETAARPTTGRNAPRAPVRDASNPESFRGADGMIDAAEMRRAQIEAARTQGTPAYSVQREWEAVAAEQQRAEAAGEVRADPLAGTSPIAPPPETRAERRAREAEEAAQVAADQRSSSGDEDQGDEGVTPAPAPATTGTRGARGTPRSKKAPARTSQTQSEAEMASTNTSRQSRTRRAQPAQALDREPRLAGGPG
jgi:hypothetical protein